MMIPGIVATPVVTSGSPPVSADPVYPLTITNASAETGDLTGWTVDGNAPDVRTGGYDGGHFFMGGTTSSAAMVQDVTVPNGAESLVDAGSARMEVSWWQTSYNANDRAGLDFEFFDGSGMSLGASIMSDVSAQSTHWVPRGRMVDIPANTRTIRFRWTWTRRFGTSSDGRVDALSALIRDVTRTEGLTITNPGGDTGDTTGWTDTVGVMGLRTANPSPKTGSHFFFGGAHASTEAWQDISMPASWEADVDAGTVDLIMRYWQSSYTVDDDARVSAEFHDGSSSLLSTKTGVWDSGMDQVWAEKLLTLAVPAGTRTIRLLLQFNRDAGSNNDGYLDDISAELAHSTRDAFTPADLFGASETGVWYDFSDTATLFQDDAGTIPVTQSGDPVGKVLDKSGNGLHATQPSAADRPQWVTDGVRGWVYFGDDGHLIVPFLADAAAYTHHTVLAAFNSTDFGHSSFYRMGGLDRTYYYHGNGIYELWQRAGRIGPITPLVSDTASRSWHTYSIESAADGYTLFQNGTQVRSGAGSVKNNTATYENLLGEGHSGYPSNAGLASFMMIGRTLTTSERAAMDGFHDAIVSELERAFTTDLGVTNGDAETGDTTGWTDSVHNWVALTDDTVYGTYCFAPNGQASEMDQDLSVPPGEESAVDAGERRVRVKYRSNARNNIGRNITPTFTFFDGSMNSLGASTMPPLEQYYNTLCTHSAAVPSGTRTIRLTMAGEQYARLDQIACGLDAI